ncbi:MAG: hypothetical protein RLN76_03095, partial [Phycisphaeraceae bacterium]
ARRPSWLDSVAEKVRVLHPETQSERSSAADGIAASPPDLMIQIVAADHPREASYGRRVSAIEVRCGHAHQP